VGLWPVGLERLRVNVRLTINGNVHLGTKTMTTPQVSSVETDGPYLFLLLRSRLGLHYHPGPLSKLFVFEGIRYFDQGYGSFLGFYDWLRNSEHRVLGVRYFPFEEFEFLFEITKQLDYVDLDPAGRWLDIYFSSDRKVLESISDDQDFGGNTILRSEDGHYALSFFAPDELDDLVGRS